MERPTRDRLKKKLNKKKNVPVETPPDDNNIFDMLSQVNKILKENPEMVTKVNKCVANIIDNKDLMTKLTEQIQTNIQQDDSSSDTEETEAESNESKQ
jgi:hypothetical protein